LLLTVAWHRLIFLQRTRRAKCVDGRYLNKPAGFYGEAILVLKVILIEIAVEKLMRLLWLTSYPAEKFVCSDQWKKHNAVCNLYHHDRAEYLNDYKRYRLMRFAVKKLRHWL